MVTLILLYSLILVIVWTALTYLDKKTIDKYEDTFDLACMIAIESCLFYFDIALWLCFITLLPCLVVFVYDIFHPAKNIVAITISVFSENATLWITPYVVCKLFNIPDTTDNDIMVIVSSSILVCYLGLLYLKKILKKKK